MLLNNVPPTPPPLFQIFFTQHTCLEVISVMRQSFEAIYVEVRAPPPPPFPAARRRPIPGPPTPLKVVREWEGAGIWPVATPPPPVVGGRPLSRLGGHKPVPIGVAAGARSNLRCKLRNFL